jgi:predicted RNA-binding protein with PIN domain
MARPLTSHLWIVDGHNLVLNVPELSRLFHHESKKAAREAAERRLADLAKACTERIHLVFDGETFPDRQPGKASSGNLDVTFVDPPAEADDWIVQLAKQEVEAGKPVGVATSDRGLLARLVVGAAIRRMAVDEFWRESGRSLRQATGAAPEKPQASSQSPTEVARLETAMKRPRPADAPRPSAPAAPAPPPEREPQEPPRAAAPPPPPRPPEPTWQEKLVAKKELGRKRQEKRIRRLKGK